MTGVRIVIGQQQVVGVRDDHPNHPTLVEGNKAQATQLLRPASPSPRLTVHAVEHICPAAHVLADAGVADACGREGWVATFRGWAGTLAFLCCCCRWGR